MCLRVFVKKSATRSIYQTFAINKLFRNSVVGAPTCGGSNSHCREVSASSLFCALNERYDDHS